MYDIEYIKSIESKPFKKFLFACRKETTKLDQVNYLKRFMKFLHENGHIPNEDAYDDVIEFGSEELTDFLRKWISELSKSSDNTILDIIEAIELFLAVNRCRWNSRTIHKLIKKEE